MLSYQWMVLFYVIVFFISCNVYSIYIHRVWSHRSINIESTALVYFMRCWLWFMRFWFPGNSTRAFVAGHRKHHATSDTPNDPHSPWYYSKKELFFSPGNVPGRPYYLTDEEIVKWAGDVPVYDDWLEHQFEKYFVTRYLIEIILTFILFGVWGPIVHITVISYLLYHFRFHNYLSHKFGYRHKPSVNADHSQNMFPIGILFAGEELAANHHDNPSVPKFSEKWWEFDMSWATISVLKFFGLIRLNSIK